MLEQGFTKCPVDIEELKQRMLQEAYEVLKKGVLEEK